MSTEIGNKPGMPAGAEAHGGDQSLAIGLYIGSIVVLIGLMLAGYGAFGGAQLAQDGSTTNKDLLWGVVMLAVGVLTLALAWFSPRRRAAVAARRTRDGQGR
ncbi:hypothetical protein ACTXG6_43650 [Pseudonocardia sp. Cha107L01]|jgi:hypothetical protein|uniref:hypothetical protein n=1 Tax=Pseudonocardia sp. Cha107L01 TaxID=3457576 RepID=UPI00403E7522